MRRREFVAGLAGAAAWPFGAVHAQEGQPLLGVLHSASASGVYKRGVESFIAALADTGFTPGRNLRIEYRWAGDDFAILPQYAEDLVSHNSAVIFAAGGDIAAIAAKRAAASRTPVVFAIGADPIKAGLVNSLRQPGENVTGVTFQIVELRPKLIQLIRDVLPSAKSIAILINPHRPGAELVERELAVAATELSFQPRFVRAANERDLVGIAEAFYLDRPDAAVVLSDPVYLNNLQRVVEAFESLSIPTIYPTRDFVLAGGLMSYGSDIAPAYRAAGHYVAKILAGDRAANLPIQQVSKIDFVVNLSRAKIQNHAFSQQLLARADEVIE